MAIRRRHTETEIEGLAERFRASWSEGQLIKSWLRTHGSELVALVRDEDWAWINVGRALSRAGIAYRTGKPWSGENLRRAVAQASVTAKTSDRARKQSSAQAAQSVKPDGTRPPLAETGEFRIIRKKRSPTFAVDGNTRLQGQFEGGERDDDETFAIAAGLMGRQE